MKALKLSSNFFVLFIALFSCTKASVTTSEKTIKNTDLTLVNKTNTETFNSNFQVAYKLNGSDVLQVHFSGANLQSYDSQLGYSEFLGFKVKKLAIGTYTIGKDAELTLRQEYILSEDKVYTANGGTITINEIQQGNSVSGTFSAVINDLIPLNNPHYTITGKFEKVSK